MTNSRFVVISPTTLRVFEGRKFLAEYKVLGEFDAADIEAVRVADDPFTAVQESKP